MKKSKLLIIISSVLIALGVILGVTGYFMGANLNIVKDENGFHVYDENNLEKQTATFSELKNIEVQGEIEFLQIIKSDKYAISTTSVKGKNEIKFTEENGDLKVETMNEKTKSVAISIGNKKSTNTLKIYVPQNAQLDDININTRNTRVELKEFDAKNIFVKDTNGVLNMNDINSDSIQVDLSNGKAILENIVSKNANIENSHGALKLENTELEFLNASLNNGDMDIKDVKVKEESKIKNSHGSSTIKDCLFNDLKIEDNNGDIKIGNSNGENVDIYSSHGTLVSDEFISNGLKITGKNSSINLIGKFSGDTKIKSSHGNIKLTTNVEKNIYNYDIYCNHGIINVDGKGHEKVLRENNNAKNNLNIENDNGNITVDFQ